MLGTDVMNMSKFKSFVALSVIIVTPCYASTTHAQGSGGSDEAIAPIFRGKIVYDGGYEGTVSTPFRIPRNLNFGSILDAATSSKSESYRGSSRYEIEYSGNLVTGTYREQGSFNGGGTFNGTRSGTTCQLVTNEGVRFTAECGRSKFYSNIAFTDNRGRKYKSIVDTNQTSLVDYVERDKQVAIDAENARAAAAAAAARYAALPGAGPALTQKFDSFVRTDAQGWAFNRYDAGSMHNVKIVSGKAGVGTYVMRGEYTYNGGSKGSVLVEMAGSNLSCIQFWDGAFSGGGSGSSAIDDDPNRDRRSSSSSPPPAPPAQSGGFYGNCHGGAAYGC
jgi:hypothetical protein